MSCCYAAACHVVARLRLDIVCRMNMCIIFHDLYVHWIVFRRFFCRARCNCVIVCADLCDVEYNWLSCRRFGCPTVKRWMFSLATTKSIDAVRFSTRTDEGSLHQHKLRLRDEMPTTQEKRNSHYKHREIT